MRRSGGTTRTAFTPSGTRGSNPQHNVRGAGAQGRTPPPRVYFSLEHDRRLTCAVRRTHVGPFSCPQTPRPITASGPSAVMSDCPMPGSKGYTKAQGGGGGRGGGGVLGLTGRPCPPPLRRWQYPGPGTEGGVGPAHAPPTPPHGHVTRASDTRRGPSRRRMCPALWRTGGLGAGPRIPHRRGRTVDEGLRGCAQRRHCTVARGTGGAP